MVLKRSITLNPCKIFQTNQKFYLHKFSDNNDVLKGRDYLKDSKAKKALLYIKYGENHLVKDDCSKIP